MIREEENTPARAGKVILVKPRPLLLTLLCLFFFVYFALISLLCLAGLFNNAWITHVTSQYLAAREHSKTQTLLLFGAGFLLHGLSFTGILLIWNLRKSGYYFLGISCLIIAIYQLVNPLTAITSTAIYIITILLFGIFYGRMR